MMDTFPTVLMEDLPDFNQNGVLPEGDYAPTRVGFEQRFVNFGDQATRESIYDGWNHHRQALINAGLSPAARELLNGSFTTSKPSPGDIDIAVEVPVSGNIEANLRRMAPIFELLQGPAMKTHYACDAYPIVTIPESHPDYQRVTGRLISYWTKWFGRTRQGIMKGRVWATAGGFR